MKQLCSEKMPPLHTRVLLPLEVSSDRDPELEVILLMSVNFNGIMCLQSAEAH